MPRQTPSASLSLAAPAASLHRLRQLNQSPFTPDDLTAGAEVELQAAVAGRREDIDLAHSIEQSSYYSNLMRRFKAGDTSGRWLSDLQQFLTNNRSEVWENSLVVLPLESLSGYARQVLDQDLLADKSRPELGPRRDLHRFFPDPEGTRLRVPVSYLVKLALADRIGSQRALPKELGDTGRKLLGHFLNDNTSPETHSFHVVSFTREGKMGLALARESAKRNLMTQLLVAYANRKFGLSEGGQQVIIYNAPHPPERQKALNRIIPDVFYRELFMSPCLSGWDQGEEKHRYMHLCHKVLSRSQLQGVAKLREAGIIVNNLVVLPNVSSTSLANNGTHVSLGSRLLGEALADSGSGFRPVEEKYFGDLAIKVQEHFLPLFVGTFSAAPYRLGFGDFHPERALGFLPHQLDYTHLRMLWRRWKRKARLSVLRQPVTPFGPEWVDRWAGRLFGLKGDLVPDFRLIDYPVGLLSTDRSPALNGVMGNQQQLKDDLHDMGVFDRQMSLYLPCKLREFSQMGFSGFEWRHFSLFPSFEQDMAPAVSLQALVTAFSYRLIASGKISHRHIPDNPVVESERRQLMFAAALGVPTVYVRRNSRNLMLGRILKRISRVRISRRYPGYLRVPLQDYTLALVGLLKEDAADLVEAFGVEEALLNLEQRLLHPEDFSAAGRLTREVARSCGARSALNISAGEFNATAEEIFRGPIRERQFLEGLQWLESDLVELETRGLNDPRLRSWLRDVLGDQNLREYFRRVQSDLLSGILDAEELGRLIDLLLCSVASDSQQAQFGKRGETDAA